MELTLRERRLAAGFTTMRVFADAVGISRTRLFNLEFGRLNFKNLKPDEQAKIAEVLHCKVADLKKKSAQGSSFGRCKTTTESPAKIEEMLAKEYGNKLKPIDKTLNRQFAIHWIAKKRGEAGADESTAQIR